MNITKPNQQLAKAKLSPITIPAYNNDNRMLFIATFIPNSSEQYMDLCSKENRTLISLMFNLICQKIEILRFQKKMPNIARAFNAVLKERTQDKFLQKVSQKLAHVFEFDHCAAFLVNTEDSGKIFTLPYRSRSIRAMNIQKEVKSNSHGNLPKFASKQRLVPYQMGIGITGYSLELGTYIASDEMTKHFKYSADIDNVKDVEHPLNNILVVPFYSLMKPGVPVGILQFVNTKLK